MIKGNITIKDIVISFESSQNDTMKVVLDDNFSIDVVKVIVPTKEFLHALALALLPCGFFPEDVEECVAATKCAEAFQSAVDAKADSLSYSEKAKNAIRLIP